MSNEQAVQKSTVVKLVLEPVCFKMVHGVAELISGTTRVMLAQSIGGSSFSVPASLELEVGRVLQGKMHLRRVEGRLEMKFEPHDARERRVKACAHRDGSHIESFEETFSSVVLRARCVTCSRVGVLTVEARSILTKFQTEVDWDNPWEQNDARLLDEEAEEDDDGE